MSRKTAAENAAKLTPLDWVERHGDYLYGFALSRIRDKSAAEDLVQETFLAALTAKQNFAGKSSEKTWLTGILKHKIYDYYRRSSRAGLIIEEADLSSCQRFFERDDEWNGHWNPRYAPSDWRADNPAQAVDAAEFQNVLKSCLKNLPERIAGVFVMREIDGLSGDEICAALMISTSNYWTIMHRARLSLRYCLERNWLKAAARKRE